jgi:ankyrin repeat protein
MWAIAKERRDVQDFLLAPAQNSNVNIQNKHGETALIWAVEMSDAVAVSKLCEKNANAKLRTDLYKETALMLAAEHGFEDILDMVLELNPDLEARDASGRTALMRALEKEYWWIVLKLGAAGANMDAAYRSKPYMDWKAKNDRQVWRQRNPRERLCGKIFRWISNVWDDWE